VVVSAIGFALAHYASQGLPAVQQAFVVAVVFGAIYAKTGSLWLPIIAHAVFDLTALVMIYFGLESAFAQLLFN
jgi:membrane protease YdiL (CAAX protease family)